MNHGVRLVFLVSLLLGFTAVAVAGKAQSSSEIESLKALEQENLKLLESLVAIETDFAPIKRCAEKQRIYARGHAESDGDGCLDTSRLVGPRGPKGSDGPQGSKGPQGNAGGWQQVCGGCCP